MCSVLVDELAVYEYELNSFRTLIASPSENQGNARSASLCPRRLLIRYILLTPYGPPEQSGERKVGVLGKEWWAIKDSNL